MADDKKIIFSMVGVSKSFQNNKQVLKDIYLSFFYGAKIGIIGLNGSGKSTLMKIIAGLEKNYQGEVVFSPGYSVGYLAQEPHLDDTKTVKEVVMEGVQNVVDTLAEYEEINNKFGLPEYYEDPEKMDALFARQGELLQKGIAIVDGGYDNPVKYEFVAFRKMKPKMMQEAIENAEQTAEQFAKNSKSKIDKIMNADQGQFSIDDRDSNTPYIKKVRVVTTVTYSLKD